MSSLLATELARAHNIIERTRNDLVAARNTEGCDDLAAMLEQRLTDFERVFADAENAKALVAKAHVAYTEAKEAVETARQAASDCTITDPAEILRRRDAHYVAAHMVGVRTFECDAAATFAQQPLRGILRDAEARKVAREKAERTAKQITRFGRDLSTMSAPNLDPPSSEDQMLYEPYFEAIELDAYKADLAKADSLLNGFVQPRPRALEVVTKLYDQRRRECAQWLELKRQGNAPRVQHDTGWSNV